MKPIELIVQGLNSFVEKQVIDFELLTRDGLFGIVGPTGSGKTSIVDAITMALYGEMSRYDGDVRRLGQCVNTASDSAYVSFTFQITDSAGKRLYTAERGYKRQDEGLRQTLARLYVKDDGQVTVLADTGKQVTSGVIDITGLSYDDFTRSVVLPQGRFSRFLLLANKERRDMLERIFNFSRYGDNLVKKINRLAGEHRGRVETLNANLQLLGDVSQEMIDEDQNRLTGYDGILKELGEREAKRAPALFEAIDADNRLGEMIELLEQRDLITSQAEQIAEQKRMFERIIKAEAIKPFYDTLAEHKRQLEETEKGLIDAQAAHEKQSCAEAELKAKYDVSLRRKADIMPNLLAEEARVKQAQEHEAELARILAGIAAADKEINALNTRLEAGRSGILAESEAVGKLRASLEGTQDKKRKTLVTPERRANVLSALTAEKKYAEILGSYNTQKEIYETKLKSFAANKETFSAFLCGFQKSEETVNTLEKRLSAADEIKPCDASALMAKKEEQLNMANRLAVMKEKQAGLEAKLREREAAARELTEKEGEHIRASGELLRAEAALDLARRESMAHILAEGLNEGEPCPVCGATDHPKPALKPEAGSWGPDGDGQSEAAMHGADEAEALKKRHDALAGELIYLKMSLQNADAAIVTLTAEAAGNTPETAAELERLSAEYTGLEKALKAWEQEKAALQESLTAESRRHNGLSVKKARLEEALNKDAAALDDRRAELERTSVLLKECEELYGFYKHELKTEAAAPLAEEIERLDKARLELDNAEEKIRAAIKEREDALEKSGQVCVEAEKAILSLGASRGEKADTASGLARRISELSPDGPPEGRLGNIRRELEALTQAEERDKLSYEKAVRLCREAAERRAYFATNREQARSHAEAARIKLDNVVTARGIDNLEGIIGCFENINQKSGLEKNIRSYEDALREVNARAASIAAAIDLDISGEDTPALMRQTLDRRALNRKTITRLQEEGAEIKQSTDTYTREQAVLKERIAERTETLAKITGLKREKKEQEYRLSLYDDLSKLFGGNRFAEALSAKQLGYITAEATRRLRAITNSRYALELYGTDFVIRDDFNGGVRRSPKTLSGGETFIVSLCLSLALSSRIQLKNSAPLEFFFLDEGFGTLDAQTVDTVIEALEKLKVEKLCVGLITHVDELKLRLNRQLIVLPPVQGVRGTTVRID